MRLTAGGRTLTQPLVVRMDPRIKTPPAALQQQFALSQKVAAMMTQAFDALEVLRAARKAHPDDKGLAELEGETEPKRPWEKREEKPALAPWNARLAAVYQLFQSTDEPPVPQAVKAAEQVLKETGQLLQRWEKLKR